MVGEYPSSLHELLEIIQNGGVTLYSGGTDLMVTKRFKERVAFLQKIPELKRIERENGDLLLGAAATYDELLAAQIPSFMKDVFLSVASPAIRNRGTIGGNICNASPAGDTLPMWYALHASVELKSLGADGSVQTRTLPMEQFILGIRKLALRENEVLTAVRVPAASLESDCVYYYKKVGARRAEAISKVSFFGTARMDGERMISAACAFGAVGITVVCPPEANEMLSGMTRQELAKEKQRVQEAYLAYVKPIDDQRSSAVYRKKVAGNLLADFLDTLTEG